MITIHAGLKRKNLQPYTITFDHKIFFITHDEDTGNILFNCFVDDEETQNYLKEILKKHLTTGKNVLY